MVVVWPACRQGLLAGPAHLLLQTALPGIPVTLPQQPDSMICGYLCTLQQVPQLAEPQGSRHGVIRARKAKFELLPYREPGVHTDEERSSLDNAL